MERNALREALEAERFVVAPGCYDALSARIVEQHGFGAVYMSGLAVTASLLLKLDDREQRAGDDILQVIGIKDHSITASILTIRDKVIFLEIQSLIKQGMEIDAALSAIAKTFSLSSEAVEDIFQKFNR